MLYLNVLACIGLKSMSYFNPSYAILFMQLSINVPSIIEQIDKFINQQTLYRMFNENTLKKVLKTKSLDLNQAIKVFNPDIHLKYDVYMTYAKYVNVSDQYDLDSIIKLLKNISICLKIPVLYQIAQLLNNPSTQYERKQEINIEESVDFKYEQKVERNQPIVVQITDDKEESNEEEEEEEEIKEKKPIQINLMPKQVKRDDENAKQFMNARISKLQRNTISFEEIYEILVDASNDGDTKTIRYAINSDLMAKRDKNNKYTILHKAIVFDKTKLVKNLIDYGCDVNEVDKNGNNGLHLAIKYSDNISKLCKLLIEGGTNPHAKNKSKETPYNLTTDKDIIKILDSYK